MICKLTYLLYKMKGENDFTFYAYSVALHSIESTFIRGNQILLMPGKPQVTIDLQFINVTLLNTVTVVIHVSISLHKCCVCNA